MTHTDPFHRSGFRRPGLGVVCVLALAIIVLVPNPGDAAEIVVDRNCTLVDAIEAANLDQTTGFCSAGSGADVIELTADVMLEEVHNRETGPTGTPVVRSRVEISGNAHTVGRAPTAPPFRIFHVDDTGSLSLTNVVVTGGLVEDVPAGGAQEYGGGILGTEFPEIILRNTTVSGNEARIGGGVWTDGRLLVADSSFVANRAGSVSAIWADDSSLPTDPPYDQALITRSTFEAYELADTYTIHIASGLDSVIASSTILNGHNGIRLYARSYPPPVRRVPVIVNSTITSHTDTGVETLDYSNGAILANVTVTYNSTGLYDKEQGYNERAKAFGSVWAENNSHCFNVFEGAENVGGCIDFQPLTGLNLELADNGGPTQTHALLAGSSAIDAVSDCRVRVDQRGYVRSKGRCDAGAYEYGAKPPAPLSISVNGDCPGEMTVTVESAAPNSEVEIHSGPGPGTWIVFEGGCIGSVLDLYALNSTRKLITDASGRAESTSTVSASQCGRSVQAIDTTTCAVSPLASFLGD